MNKNGHLKACSRAGFWSQASKVQWAWNWPDFVSKNGHLIRGPDSQHLGPIGGHIVGICVPPPPSSTSYTLEKRTRQLLQMKREKTPCRIFTHRVLIILFWDLFCYCLHFHENRIRCFVGCWYTQWANTIELFNDYTLIEAIAFKFSVTILVCDWC